MQTGAALNEIFSKHFLKCQEYFTSYAGKTGLVGHKSHFLTVLHNLIDGLDQGPGPSFAFRLQRFKPLEKTF